MTAETIVKELPKGLINWYDFRKDSCVLHITNEENSVTQFLRENCARIDCVSVEEILKGALGEGRYDYIVLINQLESSVAPQNLLASCKKCIKEDGTMLLGVDNRLGIKYFCGDRDPFTGRSFDGVENYHRTDINGGRCYSKSEIDSFLDNAGFCSRKSYSIMPQINCPQMIFSENYLPKEDLTIRYFPIYNFPDSVFLEEAHLYKSLVENGLFHAMANGYLIECTALKNMSNVNQVTISMDRGLEDAMLTIIRENNVVEKCAVYKEGKARLKQLEDNGKALKQRGINVVDAELKKDKYIMPYVNAELAVVYLRKLIFTDKEKFVKEMDRFRDCILNSSEHVRESKEDGIILKSAYFDMVPINCFYLNGEFVFFDQEFVRDFYPANVMILRTIEFVYSGDNSLERIIPKKFFYDRYALTKNLSRWIEKSNEFLTELRNERELRVYYENVRANLETIHTNRQRMNYSEVEYQRLFVDIFSNLDRKKLILFGSGKFSKKFIALYGKNFKVDRIVDNNSTKWGTMLDGISIYSPDCLLELDREEYKVIICVKNYPSILQQLQAYGIKDIGIYDSNKNYKITQDSKVVSNTTCSSKEKKYHTGYIAGVFDLYHIGHLNMFKRAKEQCEYLIVGVVSDEGVQKHKKVQPFIPFEERIEMVRACKFVDEAVEIPFGFGGSRDAYRLYHFDVQFSGSDYENDPNWLAEREFLRKQGSDMVFFPYTEQTSSSKIKALINKQLDER